MSVWITIAFVVAIIYFINQYFFSYWTKQGIPFKEPTFLLGEFWDILTLKRGLGDYFEQLYKKYKNNKIFGLYCSYRPTLLVNDPVLIQEVMIKDFTSFHDRGFPVDEENDPLSANLFELSGQRWRDLRVKLSPTFTSGKLKSMYPTIRDCAQVMENYLEKEVKSGNKVYDMRDLLARFTTNVISSVAFGIDNDCINDRDNIFRKIGLKIFESNYKSMFRNILSFFLPKLMLLFKIRSVDREVEDFIVSIVKQTIDHRENDKSYERKDFMQLMILLKNQGYISVDKDDKKDELNGHDHNDMKKLTFNEIAAQAFLFFIAGFETSSSTSNLCLLELCKNPKTQTKAQEEIDRVMKAANSKEVTYDMLGEMKYLECCIDEALRKYPIVPMLNRECTKDHTFTGTKHTIEKGTTLFIPVQGIQRDPDIYDNPMEFRPERFLDSPTGNGNSKGLFYMPFGDGPRNCIGARMGKLQTKLALAVILSKFSFELVDKSLMDKEFEADPAQFITTPKEPIMLKVEARV
ncbi:unnamed protein product [Chironomus riparius]|uniref:Cytochrome P450 n=1 Tax=Chironomus riparius TaxID=315576 RepID=A0A9N9WQ60_9DIPT|nr:unnamed protein product [Chironomus riparius]